MSDTDDTAETVAAIERGLSVGGATIFRQALEANEYNALRALGGLCEAYAKQERAISAGYRRLRP